MALDIFKDVPVHACYRVLPILAFYWRLQMRAAGRMLVIAPSLWYFGVFI